MGGYGDDDGAGHICATTTCPLCGAEQSPPPSRSGVKCKSCGERLGIVRDEYGISSLVRYEPEREWALPRRIPASQLPGAFYVTGYRHGERVFLRLEVLGLSGEAATEAEARSNLVKEVRRQILRRLTSPSYRQRSDQRRGMILDQLAWLSNPEIDGLLDVQIEY